MGRTTSVPNEPIFVQEVPEENNSFSDIPQDWYLDPIDTEVAESQYSENSTNEYDINHMAEEFLAKYDVLDTEKTDEAPIPLGVKKSSLSNPNLNNAKNLAGILTGNYNEEDGELSWQIDALCAQTDPEAFFPEKGGSTRDAKKVCTACTVRAQCLEYALANDERFGIWGGLSERERRRIRKRST